MAEFDMLGESWRKVQRMVDLQDHNCFYSQYTDNDYRRIRLDGAQDDSDQAIEVKIEEIKTGEALYVANSCTIKDLRFEKPYKEGKVWYKISVEFSSAFDLQGQKITPLNNVVSKDMMRTRKKKQREVFSFVCSNMALENNNIRHELVGMCISDQGTDQRYSSIFGQTRIPDKTPDFMFRTEDKKGVIVLEIATVSDDVRAFEIRWQEKMAAYGNDLQILAKETGKSVLYEILIAGSNGVRTSMDLSPKIMFLGNLYTEVNPLDNIEFHHRVGSRIFSRACEMNILSSISRDNETYGHLKGEIERSAAEGSSSFPEDRDKTKKGYITNKLIEHWENLPVDSEEFKATIESIEKKLEEQSLKDRDFFTKDVERRTRETADRMIDKFYKECKSVGENYGFGKRYLRHKDASSGKLRRDLKAPCQFPLLIPKDGLERCDLTENLARLPSHRVPDFNGAADVHKAWNHCVAEMRKVSERFEKRDIDKQIAISKMDKIDYSNMEDPVGKRLRQRISLPTDASEETNQFRRGLATLGINGLKFKSAVEKEISHMRSKIPFSLDVETKDIERFIRGAGKDLFKPQTDKIWGNLLERDSLDSNEEQKMTKEYMKKFENTVLGCSLALHDEILEELNPTLRNWVKQDEMVLKKLTSCDVWILCKPTRPDDDLYFSIAWRSDQFRNYELPFKSTVNGSTTDWECIDFISLNRNKLMELQGMRGRMASMHAMFREAASLPILKNPMDADDKISRSQSNTLLSLMVCHESKTETAAMLQDIRYAYSEVVRSPDLYVEPLKVLSKFGVVPRSRLYVWIVNSVINAFKKMCVNRVKMVQKADSDGSDNSGDNFHNLLSWVDKSEVTRFGEVINICYLGVLRNREDTDKTQGLHKIFGKVAGQEQLMKTARIEYMGYGTNDDIFGKDHRSHEFSSEWVRECGRVARFKICKKAGVSSSIHDEAGYKDFLLNKLTEESISNRKIEDFMTFKASAERISDTRFCLNRKDPPSKKTLQKFMEQSKKRLEEEGRLKAMAVTVLTDEEAHAEMLRGRGETLAALQRGAGKFKIPYTMITPLLEELESKGGVYATLFKKPQNTGDREIFILDWLSRVVVSYMETLLEVVCKLQENEMISKREEKHGRMGKLLANASKALAGMGREDLATIACHDSMDASKWCQQFVMTTFGAYLHALLPTEFFHLCARILNTIASKSLKVPQKLLLAYVNNKSDFGLSKGSESTNEMKKQFLGVSEGENDLMDPYSVLLKNVSNFMQGILNMTSSSLHAAFADREQDLCAKLFRKWAIKRCLTKVVKSRGVEILLKENVGELTKEMVPLFKRYKMLNTNEVSSDDGAKSNIAIVPVEDQEEARLLLLSFSAMRIKSYRLMCATLSMEKSNLAMTIPFREFNSIWTVYNTVVCVLVKFVHAALVVPVESNPDSRQLVYSNLRRQIVENGGSHLLCSIVQRAQRTQHYSILGLNTNILFDMFLTDLIKSPHPALGYFVSEPEMNCGLLGAAYAEYTFLKRSKEARDTMKYLLTNGESEESEDGKPSVRFDLMMGDHKKYKTFIENLMGNDKRADIDFEPMSKGNLDVYFGVSKDLSDSIYLGYQKALGRGAAKNFAFENASAILASSTYVLQTPCVYRTVKTDMSKEESDLYKYRLIELSNAMGGAVYTNETLEKKSYKKMVGEKRSLWQMVRESNARYRSAENYELSAPELGLLYPNALLYDAANRIKESVLRDLKSENNIVRISRKAERHVTFSTERRTEAGLRSLKDLVEKLWLKKEQKMTDNEAYICLESYQNLYPWLRSSFIETLANEDCPYTNPKKLADFVRNDRTAAKTFKVMCAGRQGMSSTAVMDLCMRRNYMKGEVIMASEELKDDVPHDYTITENAQDSVNRQLIVLNTHLVRLGELPQLGKAVESNYLENLLRFDYREIDKLSYDSTRKLGANNFYTGHSKSLRTLALMVDLANGRLGERLMGTFHSGFQTLLKSCDFGNFGVWTTAQTKLQGSENKWQGPGVFVGVINKKIYELSCENSSVTLIKAKNPVELSECRGAIKHLMRSCGLSASGSTYYSKHNLSKRLTHFYYPETGRVSSKPLRTNQQYINVIFTEGNLNETPVEEPEVLVKMEDVVFSMKGKKLVCSLLKRPNEPVYEVPFYPMRDMFENEFCHKETDSIMMALMSDLKKAGRFDLLWVVNWFCNVPVSTLNLKMLWDLYKKMLNENPLSFETTTSKGKKLLVKGWIVRSEQFMPEDWERKEVKRVLSQDEQKDKFLLREVKKQSLSILKFFRNVLVADLRRQHISVTLPPSSDFGSPTTEYQLDEEEATNMLSDFQEMSFLPESIISGFEDESNEEVSAPMSEAEIANAATGMDLSEKKLKEFFENLSNEEELTLGQISAFDTSSRMTNSEGILSLSKLTRSFTYIFTDNMHEYTHLLASTYKPSEEETEKMGLWGRTLLEFAGCFEKPTISEEAAKRKKIKEEDAPEVLEFGDDVNEIDDEEAFAIYEEPEEYGEDEE